MTESPHAGRLRLQTVRDDPRGAGLNGIESIEVDGGHYEGVPAQRTLLVHCLLPVPSELTAGAVRVAGGVRVDPALNPVRVEWAMPATRLRTAHADDPAMVSTADVAAFGALPGAERVLVVRTSSSGDFSTYRFAVTDLALNFDPRLAEVPFSFKVDCPADVDPRPPEPTPTAPASVPQVDYLSRDYESLRRLLLDRLSLLLPGWSDRGPADLGVTLVEMFAYLGDQLAYAQDAVAAEAYLGTARRRVSVRRHARLLDYRMHEGATARTWLALDVDDGADGRVLEAGREVLPAGEGSDVVFHTLHPLTLSSARNVIDFYTWSEEHCTLRAGSTTATLLRPSETLNLRAGDVLLFEEIRGGDGRPDSADPARRWAVRLDADPTPALDPLTGADLLEVSWHPEDALPFPLHLRRFPERPDPGDGFGSGVTAGSAVVRGNVVLAEHGALVGPEPLVPAEVPARHRYRPRLGRAGLAHAVPYDHRQSLGRPAAAALAVSPPEAVPALVEVHDGATAWTVVPDLLSGDRFAAECVVEIEDDGRAYLRFGDYDFGLSPTPGTAFWATYRVGGGRVGNVGRDALTRLAEPIPGVRVRNPVPAQGGTDPEPVEQVRQWAPQAFRAQRRAVTDADYAEVAARHPQVRQARAARRWTGSWYTESVVVDRRAGSPADQAFRKDVAGYLDHYRMAGEDVRVTALVPVSLDIVVTVQLAPGHPRGEVKRALMDVFTAGNRADGTPGFFHPDNLAFGRPVYLSQVVAAAMAVHGVLWVDTDDTPPKRNRFQRWGRPASGERAAGRIPMGPLEVARCLSDPSLPEHGRIDFLTEGGT